MLLLLLLLLLEGKTKGGGVGTKSGSGGIKGEKELWRVTLPSSSSSMVL